MKMSNIGQIKQKTELQYITKNKDGNYYAIYKVKVQRGIKGKTKSKVDELLIVGIPKSKFKDFCKKHNINVIEEE